MQPSGLDGVYRDAYGFYTRNMVPGARVYGERLQAAGGAEYRMWNPRRSKLCAWIRIADRAYKEAPPGVQVPPGPERIPLGRKMNCLYLGASTGTTVSHVSDIASEGSVLAVEKSARSFRDLLLVAARRANIVPVLGDAAKPESYSPLLPERVDVVYQDIAQREQAEFFMRNCLAYLKPQGVGVLMLKARSVSVARDPEEIYAEVEAKLSERMRVLGTWELEPYHRDHVAMLVQRS
jgi:fibrillarin-like pre-rRNA processing protein